MPASAVSASGHVLTENKGKQNRNPQSIAVLAGAQIFITDRKILFYEPELSPLWALSIDRVTKVRAAASTSTPAAIRYASL